VGIKIEKRPFEPRREPLPRRPKPNNQERHNQISQAFGECVIGDRRRPPRRLEVNIAKHKTQPRCERRRASAEKKACDKNCGEKEYEMRIVE